MQKKIVKASPMGFGHLAQQQAEAESQQSAQDAAQGNLDTSSLAPEHVQALSQMIQKPQE